jgi:MOSC domain-containing protein YiiM
MIKEQSVVGIQVGQARRVVIAGRSILTAIRKAPYSGPAAVNALGLVDDEQADPSVHGGLAKAVYAYPVEHYDFWVNARGRTGVSDIDSTLPHGSMGENLTLRGLLETEVWVGDVLRFRNCALRVAQPREPCFKFNAALGFNTAVKLMAESGFCGFYLSVEEPGTISAGERFEVLPGARQMGIPELFQAKMFKHLR